MDDRTFDTAVIGGGIVGLATADALLEREPGSAVIVLEAEPALARHQTGRNSGVIHSGLYYRPGSAKARLCADGRDRLYAFCADEGIPHRRCGKLVLATHPDELPGLAKLHDTGRANGLEGLRRLEPDEIRQIEPAARGVGALFVPQTGVVDFASVAEALAARIRRRGGEVRTSAAFRRLGDRRRADEPFALETAAGPVRARRIVACAGLSADRVARACGVRPADAAGEVRIVPIRGDYRALAPAAAERVRALIYPVPDLRFPFLGVHLTRRVDDRVEIGPNAIPAWAPHAWLWPGAWRLGLKMARTAATELWRAARPRAQARAVSRLVPGIEARDLLPAPGGVRAQAVRRDGRLVDDFVFAEAPGQLHVLNAPSPAATACLGIGGEIAGRVSATRNAPGSRT